MTKRLKKVLFVVLLIVASHSICDAQSLYNNSNMLVGKIEPNGIVKDHNNMMIGKIETDDDIRDKNYMLVGKVDPDGTVKDKNNMMIGKVKSDGTVVDRNNMTIGYARGIDIKQVAVFFFFKLFHSNPMND